MKSCQPIPRHRPIDPSSRARRLTPLGTAVCSGASGSGEAATRRTREMDDVGDVGGLLRRAEASCGSPWISKCIAHIYILYIYIPNIFNMDMFGVKWNCFVLVLNVGNGGMIQSILVDSRCSFFWGGALVLGIIRGVFQICSTWYRHIMYINVLELCVCYH